MCEEEKTIGKTLEEQIAFWKNKYIVSEQKNEELEIIKSSIKSLQTNHVNDDTYYLISKKDFLKGDYKKLLDDYVSKDEIRRKLEQLMYENKINMEECYICKALKEKGGYKYKKDWTSIAVMKGDNGRYRVFAWGDGEASISCNYCPHCGKRIEE